MKLLCTIFALTLVHAATSKSSAAVILNGSFEIPLVYSGSFTNFLGGSTSITGWTVVGVDAAVDSTNITYSGITFQAQQGIQWLDITGLSNSSTNGVSQNFSSVAGQAYELSFYVGSATDGSLFFPATVDLSINGSPRVGYHNPTAPSNMLDWKLFTVTFTATGATTNITFYNGSDPDNYSAALDNVSIQEVVPEPSTALLGMIGLAVLSRRRRNHE